MRQDNRREILSPDIPPHRRPLLLAMISLLIGCGAILVPLNYLSGRLSLALVEGVVMLLGVLLLVFARRTHRLQCLIVLFLLLLMTCMLYAFSRPYVSASAFVWALLIPVLSHLLLGRGFGLLVTALFLAASGTIYYLRFSPEPELLNSMVVVNVVLATLFIAGLTHAYEVRREKTEGRLRRMALYDALTGLSNRIRFRDIFERERARFRRDRTPLCLLVVDLDHFGRINDDHGHEAGDEALRFIADLFKHRLRATDLAGRLGGEEFGILLAETHGAHARLLAEALRQALQAKSFRYNHTEIPLAMTIGVAEIGTDGESFQRLFASADRRLYEGKQAGRDCVVGGAPESAASLA